MSSAASLAPDKALVMARIVAVAILLSGATVAVVGTVVTLPHGELQPERERGTLLFGLWVAAAVGATIGWGILWRRATGIASEPRARLEMEAGRLHAGAVVARLVAGYALLEFQLMLALVVSLLGDTPMLLVPSVTLFALGIFLSFPRREWFAPFEAGGARSPR